MVILLVATVSILFTEQPPEEQPARMSNKTSPNVRVKLISRPNDTVVGTLAHGS